MNHNNTRYWSFTWETNVSQRKLPSEKKLENFLNKISEHAQFQKEKGGKRGKIHYQGYFELIGPRAPKKDVLGLFEEQFGNTGGLTLRKVFSKEAAIRYTMKAETRVSDTIFCGTEEMYRTEYKELLQHKWQKKLLKHLEEVATNDEMVDVIRFRKRGIYWVEDKKGGAGKSEFITFLRAGQKKLTCRLLPIDSVDRLLAAVIEVSKKTSVDVFMIDDTKTKGDKTSFNNMFETMERLKNGHVVSNMYGKYAEAIFKRPQILFFTNRSIHDYSKNLSIDRWYHFEITGDKKLIANGWLEKNSWDEHFGSSESDTLSDDDFQKASVGEENQNP